MDRATRGLIVGMVLGDAHVSVRRRLKPDGTRYEAESSEMRVLHSTKQRDYCEHKCALLNWALNRHAVVHDVKNGPDGRYKASQFSISHPYFKQVKGWAYPGGVKTITTRLLEMLTPEGIALWYMDDGSARVNVNKDGWIKSVATDIATYCPEEEANIARDYFAKEYGVVFNVRCRTQSPRESAFYLQANTEASRDFVRVIDPFIIPSMRYKVAHVADLSSHECRAPVGICQCGSKIYDIRRKGLCVACYSRKYYQEVTRFRRVMI